VPTVQELADDVRRRAVRASSQVGRCPERTAAGPRPAERPDVRSIGRHEARRDNTTNLRPSGASYPV